MAGILITQGTDLSAGRQVGLAAVVSATMLQALDNTNRVFPDLAEMPIPVVILIVCAIGAVIGMINGLIVAYLNVTPFIATLGTMIIVYGANSLYYDAVGSSPIAGSANLSLNLLKVSSNLVISDSPTSPFMLQSLHFLSGSCGIKHALVKICLLSAVIQKQRACPV